MIHSTAIVDRVYIPMTTSVWAYTHIMEGAKIGKNCNIGDHVFIEGGAVIGDNCTIKNGVMIWEGITIEDDVFIGPGVIFTNDEYPRSPRSSDEFARKHYSDKQNWLVKTIVRRGAAIGAGAIILPGCNIGEDATIGAGAVVVRSVGDQCVMVGIPARVIGVGVYVWAK